MSEANAVDWRKAATLGELWEGDCLDLQIDGEEIMLLHLPGQEIRCFQGMCPHQEILLAEGEMDFEKGLITCRAHAWQFSMNDGLGVNPSDCRLFRYEVKIEGDDIYVGVPTDGRLRRLRHGEQEEA